jgi:hypothetical protein
VKELYNENSKILKKEIEEDIRKCCALAELICVCGCTTESILAIQCNPHQKSNVIIHINRRTKPKIYVEA